MPELISKLTTMVSATTEGFLGFVFVVAVLALIVWAFMGGISNDSQRKLSAGKGIAGVLIFVVIAGCGAGLVNWAMTM